MGRGSKIVTVMAFGSNVRQQWANRPGLRRWGGELISWFAIALLAAAVTGLVFVALTPRLFGWQFVVVAGGSMEPAVPFGSVAVMEDVQPSELRVRDIVMFREGNGKVVTHRIVAISDDGRTLTTQGDVNNAPDETRVPVTAVQGRFRFAVPEVGRFVRWMGTQQGFVTLILVPGLTIIVLELLSIGRTLRQKPPAA
ncbi:MAG: signal peptidase I [Anaerolinea sp.]|nr:signal peptidase I [Anaerolinea sp.]